jgi:alcohol dehydrogenase class IV
MNNFIYETLSIRVIFGVGSLDSLSEEVSRLGSKALVLCTPRHRDQVEEVAQKLGALAVGIYDRAVMHMPVETAQDARNEAGRLGADVYSVAAPEAMKCIARALSKANAPHGLYQLGKSLGTPTKLSEIGMRYEDLDLAAELASKNPYYNPRPITREGIRALLEAAFHGNRPGAA